MLGRSDNFAEWRHRVEKSNRDMLVNSDVLIPTPPDVLINDTEANKTQPE